MISTKSTHQSLEFAKISLNLSSKNFIKFLEKNNKNNSGAMILTHYSGKALYLKTTAPHAISYPFTSYFGVSHGHAVSLTLEKFLKFNYVNKTKSVCNFDLENRYQTIFKILKVKNIIELETYLIQLKKSKTRTKF